jgi:hypothetical protein
VKHAQSTTLWPQTTALKGGPRKGADIKSPIEGRLTMQINIPNPSLNTNQNSFLGSLIDQIVYDSLKKSMKSEDTERKPKKPPVWDKVEAFIWISLAMPFVMMAQGWFFLSLLNYATHTLTK